MIDRCTDSSAGCGCQLIDDHEGAHAANDAGVFVTWQGSERYRWDDQPAPDWVAELPWAPCFIGLRW